MQPTTNHEKFTAALQKMKLPYQCRRSWSLKDDPWGKVTAVEVTTERGQRQKLVFRWHGLRDRQRNPNIAADEFKLLQIVRAAGIAVARPLAFDLSGEIFDTPYIVLEFIDAAPQYTVANPAMSRQIATQLSRIHAINGNRPELAFLPTQTTWLENRLGDRPANLDPQSDEARLRDVLDAVWPLSPQNKPTLLHGDFWPGNLLWQQQQLVAIVDWEDARVGDPLEDLAICRFDHCFIYGVETMQAITAEYQRQSNLNYDHLPYWDLLAALRAAPAITEWAAGWADLGRPDLTEAAIRRSLQWFINQALAALDSSAGQHTNT